MTKETQSNMKTYKFLHIIFFLSIVLSCNGQTNDKSKKVNQSSSINSSVNINFLDKKYFHGYQLSPDFDFPILSHTDNKIGSITVNFINENIEQQKEWFNFDSKNGLEYGDDPNDDYFNALNSLISKELKTPYEGYNIIAEYIPKKYINKSLDYKYPYRKQIYILNKSTSIWELLEEKIIDVPSKNIISLEYFNQLLQKRYSKINPLKQIDNTPIQTHTNMDTLVINEKKIRDYLNTPVLDGEEIGEDYMMSEEDFQIVIPLVYSSLKSSGFKFISDDEFHERMKNIFGVLPGKNSKQIMHHKDFISYVIPPSYNGAMSAEDITMMEFLYGGVFFVKKYNFIMPLAIISDFAKLANDKIVNITPQAIIYRNKYLFNDDKASLVWLLFNDKDFLEQLVRVFGYDKEEKINKMVLEKAAKQYDESNWHDDKVLKHLFAEKDCYGKVQIREGLLKTVAEATNDDNNNLFISLDDYCFRLVFPFEETEPIFSFKEKCQIIAAINNTTYPVYSNFRGAGGKAEWDPNSLLYVINIEHPEIIEEIIKNNYFGYPDLKQYIEEVKEEYEDYKNLHDIEDKDFSQNTVPITHPTVHLYTHPDFHSSFSEKTVKNKIEIRYTTSTGWDFVSIDGKTVGYIPTEELLKEKEEKKKKHSFLVEDEDDTKPEKKKGFWDNLLG
ncbi:MAG: hypothetical protein LBE36_04665 [Flavobacteriaceae bacterium]|jgi:hypothetical protein|nr:hypothetical protein [Flavobacteriaceae bacterium]